MTAPIPDSSCVHPVEVTNKICMSWQSPGHIPKKANVIVIWLSLPKQISHSCHWLTPTCLNTKKSRHFVLAVVLRQGPNLIVSMACSPRWPQTHNPLASTSWVLGLWLCTTQQDSQIFEALPGTVLVLLWLPSHLFQSWHIYVCIIYACIYYNCEVISQHHLSLILLCCGNKAFVISGLACAPPGPTFYVPIIFWRSGELPFPKSTQRSRIFGMSKRKLL